LGGFAKSGIFQIPEGWEMDHRIRLKVNGADHDLEVPARRMLVDCLRYDLGLTGTKEGCSVGVCGACTVLVDGQMVASCITLAVTADGADITTVEGLAQDGKLHPVQQAFIDHGGFQCGICTPGQVITAKALLDVNPDPTEEEIKDWMMGNLCRCTGYYGILESVKNAARTSQEAGR
jgi:carbon-monoxide dehydrogenase small subunit